MSIQRLFSLTLLSAVATSGLIASAHATVFTGDLYYTNFTGGQNVWKVGYSYNDVAMLASLGASTNIASTNGADGIIFAPNGNLLVGGQGSGNVYELNSSNGNLLNTQFTGTPSYHLTLDPSGNKVYTSDFGGRLNTLGIPIGSGNTPTTISGGDNGLTQIVFGTGGAVFYVDGSPNGFGNIGTIDLGTGVTTRLYTGVQAAHGIIFDPFTNLVTLFGAGQTGTFNPADGSSLLTSNSIYGVGDFDQGAVDGKGHALVAGLGEITFIDYSKSGDITHPDYVQNFAGFSGIDDVAPLAGLGAHPTPEPASLALFGIGLAGFAFSRRRQAMR